MYVPLLHSFPSLEKVNERNVNKNPPYRVQCIVVQCFMHVLAETRPVQWVTHTTCRLLFREMWFVDCSCITHPPRAWVQC